ncbi:serpin family protein [Dactylosporangium sp. McL0621]|uniref:serpin family protein n=1 Tax=Dactylosporangium sp. McL0621 TaxID=3415678 RepID=UPI003CF722C2
MRWRPTPLVLPPDVKAAVGLWARADVRLRPRFRDLVAGILTDDPAPIDAWSNEHTGGLIPSIPIKIDEETRLVLAGALAIETEWAEPFEEGEGHFDTGPWTGSWLWLYRSAPTLDGLAVLATAAGPITAATVRGRDNVDVVLLLGEENRGPAELLPAAIAAVTVPEPAAADALRPLVDGAFTPEGPGVSVERSELPGCTLSLPRFTVRAEHDLLAAAAVFGLGAATGPTDTTGHFPGLAEEPLAVSGAAQSATASFTALGFKAAASTYAASGAGIPDLNHDMVYVSFDRPFGFLAVDRPTGLVLFAGWVGEPDPYTEDY